MLSIGELHGVMVVRVSGEVGEAEFASIARELVTLVEAGHRRCLLNLDAVTHIRYTSLESLNALRSVFRAAGAGLAVSCSSRYLRGILRFAGVDQFFRIYGSTAEAFMSFGRREAVRFAEVELPTAGVPARAVAR